MPRCIAVGVLDGPAVVADVGYYRVVFAAGCPAGAGWLGAAASPDLITGLISKLTRSSQRLRHVSSNCGSSVYMGWKHVSSLESWTMQLARDRSPSGSMRHVTDAR